MISDSVAVTAAHCLTVPTQAAQTSVLSRDYFAVYNSKGENTYLVVHVYKVREHADIAFLQGNFKEFNKQAVDVDGFKLKLNNRLVSCGYAGGFSPPSCTDGEFTGTTDFKGKTNAFVAKGMSGGPVLNDQGRAVGVNSSRGFGGYTLFGILFGNVRSE